MEKLSTEENNIIKATVIIQFDDCRGAKHLNPSITAINQFQPSEGVRKAYRRLRIEQRGRNRERDRTAKAEASKNTIRWVNNQDLVMPFNFYPGPYLTRSQHLDPKTDSIFKEELNHRKHALRALRDKKPDKAQEVLSELYGEEAIMKLHQRRVQAYSPFAAYAGIDKQASLGRIQHTKCLLDAGGYKVALPTLSSRWEQSMQASYLEVFLCAKAPDLLYGTFEKPREEGLEAIRHHVEASHGQRMFYVMRLHSRTTSSENDSLLRLIHNARCSDIQSAITHALQGGRVWKKKCEIHEPIEVVMAMGGELNPVRHIMLQESFSQVHHIEKEFPDAFMVLIGNELFLSLPKGQLSKEVIINSLNYALEVGTRTREYKVARNSFRESSSRFEFSGLTFWLTKGRLKSRPTNRMVNDLKRIHSQTLEQPMLWSYYRKNFLYYFRNADLKNVRAKLNLWARCS